MNYRTVAGMAITAALFTAPAVLAQTDPSTRTSLLSLRNPDKNAPDSISAPPPRSPAEDPFQLKSKPSVRVSKTKFILLSAGVYAASLADMHQTLKVRNNSWWSETDPLARPFVRLPAPAYYATGLAMSTGINWLSWKMAHSRRWHKLAPLPQVLAIAGNLYGFRSNRF